MKFKDTWFYKHIGSAIAHPKNFFFCLKYPFWKQTNVWDNDFMGYSYTWYDSIEYGWEIAFGKQLSRDIAKALKDSKIPKIKWASAISWCDIKEKWGSLCLYASAPEKVRNVLDKYEILSQGYCINCGKPARYLSRGWVHYTCEDCFRKELEYTKKMYADFDIEKELIGCRLTKDNINRLYRYNNNEEEVEVDLKKEYGIDFEDLWGLK